MNSTRLSDLVVGVLDDNKAQEIVKLDVRELTNVTDYMIVASGTSNRHVRALIEHVTDHVTPIRCLCQYLLVPEKRPSAMPAGSQLQLTPAPGVVRVRSETSVFSNVSSGRRGTAKPLSPVQIRAAPPIFHFRPGREAGGGR